MSYKPWIYIVAAATALVLLTENAIKSTDAYKQQAIASGQDSDGNCIDIGVRELGKMAATQIDRFEFNVCPGSYARFETSPELYFNLQQIHRPGESVVKIGFLNKWCSQVDVNFMNYDVIICQRNDFRAELQVDRKLHSKFPRGLHFLLRHNPNGKQ